MSRTDKTKPLWVRHLEHAPRPIHDHRFGPCDLPTPTREATDTYCYWEPGSHFFGGSCCSGCNIRGCIKERQGMNTTANRKSRYAARGETRRYTRDEN